MNQPKDSNAATQDALLKSLVKLLKQHDNYNLIADSCRHGVHPDDMISQALICARLEPALLTCAPFSWVNAIVDAAALGLPVTGVGGKAWLMKRWSGKHKSNLVKYMLGWRGMLHITYRTGLFKRIDAGVVYPGEEFHYERGMNQHLRHVPSPSAPRSDDKVVTFYCEGLMSNGEYKFDVMPLDEVKAIRDKYAVDKKGNVSTVWKEHFTEMGKKTVFRRLWKWLPDHEDFSIAESIDNANNPLPAREDRAAQPIPDAPANERLLAAVKPPADDVPGDGGPGDDAPADDGPGDAVAKSKGFAPGSQKWHEEHTARALENIRNQDSQQPSSQPATDDVFLQG